MDTFIESFGPTIDSKAQAFFEKHPELSDEQKVCILRGIASQKQRCMAQLTFAKRRLGTAFQPGGTSLVMTIDGKPGRAQFCSAEHDVQCSATAQLTISIDGIEHTL